MKRFSSFPYLLWTVLFTLIPIGVVLFYAFTINDNGVISFSLANFQRLLDPLVLKLLYRSFMTALVATLLCLLIAYPIAYALTKMPLKYQHSLVVLIVLPMWMNFLLRTYAIQYLLGPTGFINSVVMLLGFEPLHLLFSQGAVLFGMVYNYIPFMIIPIYTALTKIDQQFVEAAEDLGATKRRVFTTVIFPLSLPGVISGITMTFMPAVSTFVISSLLGGGKYDLIGNMIEREFTLLYDWHFGATLSLLLMLLILVMMALLNRFGDEEGAYDD